MGSAPDNRFWIIRKPHSKGAIVKKYDTAGETNISDEILNYPDFVIQTVPSQSDLKNKQLDLSGLTDEERVMLGYDS